MIDQSITVWKAYEILHKCYPEVKEEHVTAMLVRGELCSERVGSVNRTLLSEVQRILRSWDEQKDAHGLS